MNTSKSKNYNPDGADIPAAALVPLFFGGPYNVIFNGTTYIPDGADIPAAALVPLFFGGPYNVIFNGTTYIPK